jgi:hypothetical protein
MYVINNVCNEVVNIYSSWIFFNEMKSKVHIAKWNSHDRKSTRDQI